MYGVPPFRCELQKPHITSNSNYFVNGCNVFKCCHPHLNFKWVRACSVYIFTRDNLTRVVVRLIQGWWLQVNNTKCDLTRMPFETIVFMEKKIKLLHYIGRSLCACLLVLLSSHTLVLSRSKHDNGGHTLSLLTAGHRSGQVPSAWECEKV